MLTDRARADLAAWMGGSQLSAEAAE